jgi:hypothetical protein
MVAGVFMSAGKSPTAILRWSSAARILRQHHIGEALTFIGISPIVIDTVLISTGKVPS